jgi:uncharacterized UPF0160 family protein
MVPGKKTQKTKLEKKTILHSFGLVFGYYHSQCLKAFSLISQEKGHNSGRGGLSLVRNC